MNLVQIVADGAPGGGTTMVLGLVDDLVTTRGWRPTVVSQPGSFLQRQVERRGLRFLPFDFFGPMADPTTPWRLARLLRGLDRPVAHLHGLRAAHHALGWPARRCLGPAVYTVHGLHQLYLPWPRVLRALADVAERRATRCAARTVYVSQSDLRLAREHRLLSARACVEVVPNGVALDELPVRSPDAIRHDVVFVGRMVGQKDPETAATVLARLAAAGLRCVFAGGGPLLDACRARLAAEPGGDRVEVTGELDRAASLALLASARVALMTSRWEAQGLVAVEALALGVPVVGPAIPGLSEVVDAGCGRLLERPSVDDYVTALRAFVADPGRAAAAGRTGAERARRLFDRRAGSDRYAALYASLAAGAAPASAGAMTVATRRGTP